MPVIDFINIHNLCHEETQVPIVFAVVDYCEFSLHNEFSVYEDIRLVPCPLVHEFWEWWAEHFYLLPRKDDRFFFVISDDLAKEFNEDWIEARLDRMPANYLLG